MFGLFGKKKDPQDEQMYVQLKKTLGEMGASVLLITHNGELVFVSETLKSKPRDWFGGQVMEVSISRPGTSPYFIYYENDAYYVKMVQGIQPIGGAHNFSEYRSNISQILCMYLISHLRLTADKDIAHEKMSFSHNRIHTNVIAYVNSLSNWYPIQHSSDEPDSATEVKVKKVNSGVLSIRDVIAISEASPA